MQSISELQTLYDELSKEIFELNNEKSLHRKLEKPHLFRSKKRKRAQVLTLLKEKGEKPRE